VEDVLGLVNVLILLLLVWKPSSCIRVHVHVCFFLGTTFCGLFKLQRLISVQRDGKDEQRRKPSSDGKRSFSPLTRVYGFEVGAGQELDDAIEQYSSGVII
jgi:hypothetical protein